MHLIERHVAQRIIEVTVSGFWDDAHFEAFVTDLRAAIADFPAGDAPPATLYNYTHAAIQTQSVVARMRALAQHPSMIDRRVALYTEGVLARQQAKRVAEGRDNMQVFDSRIAAIDFLMQDRADLASTDLSGLTSYAQLDDVPRKISFSSRSTTQIRAAPTHWRK